MDAIVSLMKALSDRNRLRIVIALTGQNELCACQLIELLGVSGATVSRHMDILLRCGCVESRKEGRWVHYRLKHLMEADPLISWLKTILENSEQVIEDTERLGRICTGTDKMCGGAPREEKTK